MRLAWLQDIHLDSAGPERTAALCADVASGSPDGVLVGGDIAEAADFADHLLALAESLRRPLWFVLGNHDFYGSSVKRVRAAAAALAERSPWLRWLPAAGVVPLVPGWALIGHDGWADGRAGDYAGSDAVMSDFVTIEELREAALDARGRPEVIPGDPRRLPVMQALGDETAAWARETLPRALERARRVLLLTHVPPFPEASWYGGKPSGAAWQPYMVCAAHGRALLEVMERHPRHELTVLCGHTHGAGTVRMLPNLLVRTGGARYGEPRRQDWIDLEEEGG